MHHSLLLFQCPGSISKSSHSLVLSLKDCGRIRPGGAWVQCSCCQHDCRHSRGQQCSEPLAKEQVPPFHTTDRGFWFILTTTLCRHTDTNPFGSLHVSTSSIKKLPINEALTPKGALHFYWMTIVPFTSTHSVSIRGETTASSVMNKSQSSIGASISNISACKFDTVCHNPTHCSRHMVVAMAIELSDESCTPVRYLHHSNQSDSLFMLTAVHQPTNLSVLGFRICTHTYKSS